MRREPAPPLEPQRIYSLRQISLILQMRTDTVRQMAVNGGDPDDSVPRGAGVSVSRMADQEVAGRYAGGGLGESGADGCFRAAG